jgi:NAD(P)-dependent dehydrogenase (short-subunit alcohol dehydrogenase family)
VTEAGRLAGEVALVTGGGRGIGRAVALALAAEGANVAVAARTRAEIDAVATQCRESGIDALAIKLDITHSISCLDAVAACERELGSIGILVHSAGIATSQKFTEIDEETWNRTLEVDLTGAFHVMRAVLPHMLERGHGRVIAISSIAGRLGGAYVTPYSVAKHGLIGLMRSLASEYPRSGVTFNSVCPSYVEGTSLTDLAVKNTIEKTGRSREQAVAALRNPQGGFVRSEEVAALCLLLAGPEGRSINGQAINVDGGTVQS